MSDVRNGDRTSEVGSQRSARSKRDEWTSGLLDGKKKKEI
jgi:hypothetical protein